MSSDTFKEKNDGTGVNPAFSVSVSSIKCLGCISGMHYCILWNIMVYICAYQMYIIKRKYVKRRVVRCFCDLHNMHLSTRFKQIHSSI